MSISNLSEQKDSQKPKISPLKKPRFKITPNSNIKIVNSFNKLKLDNDNSTYNNS